MGIAYWLPNLAGARLSRLSYVHHRLRNGRTCPPQVGAYGDDGRGRATSGAREAAVPRGRFAAFPGALS